MNYVMLICYKSEFATRKSKENKLLSIYIKWFIHMTNFSFFSLLIYIFSNQIYLTIKILDEELPNIYIYIFKIKNRGGF